MDQVISLYSGAGGIDEGLDQAGLKTTIAIDFERDCLHTIKLNHPDCEVICGRVGDFIESLPRAKIVVGGPPCPEFSRAKRGRTFDMCEVNNFWQAVEHCKPEFYLMENVQDVKRKLWKGSHLVDCADYGVPQNRVRRFFTNLPLPRPTHSSSPQPNLQGEILQKWISVKDALGLDGMILDKSIPCWKSKANTRSTDEPSRTVLADEAGNGVWYIAPNDMRGNQLELSRPIDLPAPTITVHRDFELTNTKVLSPKGMQKLVIVDRKTTFGERDRQYSIDRFSPTLLTDSRLWLDDLDSKKSRKLTNAELAILQGFPTDYKFYGGKGSVKRQIGNAVPPPVIKAFFSQITCEVLA